MELVGHHSQNGQFTRSNDPQSKPREGKPVIWPIFGCYYPRHFMMTKNSDVIFAKILHGPLLRPLLWSQLVSMAEIAYLQGQTIPRAGKPPNLLIFVCYSPQHFMVTQNSNVIYAKNLHGPRLMP
ncbi:hypothetical protein H5410_049311 [Solanum commersonii]|uniref:Uncharacterized protein n=1 Tax=Solanum commersonii TaxID=4109 RepID=A0A9J5WU99_SOLCO|nr:hypothetical protein H5410_049311 [Solanum commersonii]